MEVEVEVVLKVEVEVEAELELGSGGRLEGEVFKYTRSIQLTYGRDEVKIP